MFVTDSLTNDIDPSVSLLPEQQLEQQMRETVEPFLESVVRRGKTCREELYYELFPLDKPGGTVVISHGFAEAGRKYHELCFYFLRRGYQVAVMDHRGHGKSVRQGPHPDVAYVDYFDRYAEDLHGFMAEIILPQFHIPGLPLVLYGHSMGGCIAARYLELYPDDFDRAVLNAPMLGLKLGLCPSWAALLLCEANILLGRGGERLFYQGEFDPQEPFSGSSASSPQRHAYYQAVRRQDPALHTSSASYRWARESILAGWKAVGRRETAKVKIPVLLFQAGEDTLVTEKAQQKFIQRIAGGRLIEVPASRHEIYRAPNEILARYLTEIFRFYDGGDAKPHSSGEADSEK